MSFVQSEAARIVQQLETSERDRKHYRHDQIENYSVSKAAITRKCMALLKEACDMFDETGCVPGIDGEQVPAERIVPDAKAYISETIDEPETMYDPEIWDTPGFALVLSWLAQKWSRRCQKLAPRVSRSPEQYLTKEQQKACLDSAAAELIWEITHKRSLN
jgi:hypothetical protein